MQLRHVLETELDPWAPIDAAWDDDLWDDEAFDDPSAPGEEDELAAAERWLEAHPLDDETSTDGQALLLDLPQDFN